MKSEIIYEVKGGANATLEWTPVLSEAVTQFDKAHAAILYQLTTGTGNKVAIRRK